MSASTAVVSDIDTKELAGCLLWVLATVFAVSGTELNNG